MKRRDFIKTTSKGVALAAISSSGMGVLSSCVNPKSSNSISVYIPLPIQVVIDDVGWWSGKDGEAENQPYRTGINRNHVLADYEAVVELGKSLGIRPQAATILCEWDRGNILRKIPHSTWMGKDWDNSKRIGPWLDEAAEYINNNKQHIEISMHGLAHEWWIDGIMSRAEWAESVTGIMRPKGIVEQHIEAFVEIMRQNNLGDAPKSFVPTNFSHTFGVSEGRKVSMAQILKEHGFTYVNTPFDYEFHNQKDVQYDLFGVDSGILTVDRGHDLLDWNVIGEIPHGKINKTTCGMHWANLLHPDPERNSEIVQGWVDVLAPYNERPDSMLAKNSVFFQKQLVHHVTTKIEVGDNTIKLDFLETNSLGTVLINDELTVKVQSNKELSFSSNDIVIKSVSLNKKDNSFQYSLELKRKGMDKAIISF